MSTLTILKMNKILLMIRLKLRMMFSFNPKLMSLQKFKSNKKLINILMNLKLKFNRRLMSMIKMSTIQVMLKFNRLKMKMFMLILKQTQSNNLKFKTKKYNNKILKHKMLKLHLRMTLMQKQQLNKMSNKITKKVKTILMMSHKLNKRMFNKMKLIIQNKRTISKIFQPKKRQFNSMIHHQTKIWSIKKLNWSLMKNQIMQRHKLLMNNKLSSLKIRLKKWLKKIIQPNQNQIIARLMRITQQNQSLIIVLIQMILI